MIAEATKMSGWDDPKADILRLVYNWLSHNRNRHWLMIVDNADDESVFFKSRAASISDEPEDLPILSDFLPQSPNGSILFTSRNRDVAYKLTGDFDSIIEVNPMSEDDALALLRKKLGSIARQDEATELIHALDSMPLALTQAAAFIKQRKPRMSISKYTEQIRRSDDNRAWLLEKDVGDIRRDSRASNSIMATWHISFEYIRQKWPTAARLLSLMSLFDRQGIPESLLQGRYARRKDDDADLTDVGNNADFDDDIQTLTSFSLVEMSVDGREFEMHRLVQFSTKKWLELKNELELWNETYVTLMDKNYPKGKYENWPTCQMLFPHAEAVLNNKPTEAGALKAWASVLHKAALYAKEMGQYSKARDMGSHALQVREAVLGGEHKDTLSSFNNIGNVLFNQGRYDEAEEMHERALEGRKRVLGVEHQDTINSFNNIGNVLFNQGRYDEAEEMHERVLEGRKRVLGVEHQDTINSFNNIGNVLFNQGRYDEAEEMHKRALEGRKRVLGVEHPDTLQSLNNLGTVLELQGRYNEAEAMHKRALEGKKRVLGVEHPDTLRGLSSLGIVLRRQGRYNEAEAMHKRALEGEKRVLGESHPNTLVSMGNLALTYLAQGHCKDAEALQVQVLEKQKMKLGADHPSTLVTMHDHALTLRDLRRTNDALSLMENCYELKLRVLGDQHPRTLNSRKRLERWRGKDVQPTKQNDS
ncbi:uncharacterized protein N0V89_007873 [Didymosphaeria variabile]|uniref:DUF7779 domain-containing protein n=1 Tax=Didymosphaeria variabile TaxID=1932322 RepID=A0A9W9C9X0_9PLEO|nr:uncharacterized protein N0V89_007873 [Didymosphaeria variabile]KAJ4352524.1 hypothetical protein N0V89_007873 [Didymosphaeria variabile]